MFFKKYLKLFSYIILNKKMTSTTLSNINIEDVRKYLLDKGKSYRPRDLNDIRYAFIDVINKKEKERLNVMKVKITENVIKEIIYSFVKKDGEKLNAKSYDVYEAKAKRMKIWDNIQKLIDNKDDKDKINDILNNIKKRDYMTARKKETKASYFSDMVFYNQLINYNPIKSQLNQYVFNRFNQIIKETEKIRKDETTDKVLFDKLKITYTQFRDIVDNITNKKIIIKKDGNDDVSINLTPTEDEIILLNLYKNLPIRDNFGECILTNKNMEDESVNYYNITDATFHLNNYKKSSMSVFGKRVYRIPKYLNDIITDRYNRGYRVLFGKNKTTFYKDTKLSKKFSEIFKKYFNADVNIGINDIRRAYTTYYNENKSVKQQREMANRMLHSFDTARGIYNREQNKE